MFTTLLKVPIESTFNGIRHIHGNSNSVITWKEALLSYEELDKSKCDYGWVYCFFIIAVEDGDIIQFDDFSQTISISSLTSDQAIFHSAKDIRDLCEKLLSRNHLFSSQYHLESLLRSNLSAFFSKVIQLDARKISSSIIWKNYEWVLRALNKSVNYYVPQNTIDSFLISLLKKYEIYQYGSIAAFHGIAISSEVSSQYVKSRDALSETIKIANELLVGKSYFDATSSRGPYRIISEYSDHTPCGQIGIHVQIIPTFKVSLAIGIDNCTTTVLDITSKCENLRANFGL